MYIANIYSSLVHRQKVAVFVSRSVWKAPQLKVHTLLFWSFQRFSQRIQFWSLIELLVGDICKVSCCLFDHFKRKIWEKENLKTHFKINLLKMWLYKTRTVTVVLNVSRTWSLTTGFCWMCRTNGLMTFLKSIKWIISASLSCQRPH